MTDKSLSVKPGVYPSIDQPTKKDHLITLIKSITSGSGFLPSLIGDYAPSDKQKRLIATIEDLWLRVERLEENKVSQMKPEEIEYIIRECLKGVATNYQTYKIHSFKGILINSLVTDLTQTEKEYYLYLVNTLSELHLQILAFLNNPTAYSEAHKLDKNLLSQASFNNVLKIAIPNVPGEVLKSAYEELYQKGFTNTTSSIFGLTTTVTGIEIVSGRITPLGNRFIKFCTEY